MLQRKSLLCQTLSSIRHLYFYQVWLRRVHDVPVGGLPAPLPLPHQRLPRARLPVPHRAVVKGPHPHRLRAQLGAAQALLRGARVQERVPGAYILDRSSFLDPKVLLWHGPT